MFDETLPATLADRPDIVRGVKARQELQACFAALRPVTKDTVAEKFLVGRHLGNRAPGSLIRTGVPA